MTYGRMRAVLCGSAVLLMVGIILTTTDAAVGDDGVKQTFVVQGLHCPPCASTVEGALKRTKGIESAKVDWNSKNAWITFDEMDLPIKSGRSFLD